MNKSEWFINWFDSEYYHLLYDKRNYNEAELFINNLCKYLNLQPSSKVWDIACGKGRHALVLNKNKLNVTGTDLSLNSITEANKFKNETLSFSQHDMRLAFKENYFDAAFNLFTSLGYFSQREDNCLVFKNVSKALKVGGFFIIDFFNSTLVSKNIKTLYEEEKNGIHFLIRKKIENKRILKSIAIKDKEQILNFEECVSLLDKQDFEEFASKAKLTLIDYFGNYKLEKFDENKSERLILIFKK